MDIRKLSQDIQAETEKIIVGKSDRIRLVIMAVLGVVALFISRFVIYQE